VFPTAPSEIGYDEAVAPEREGAGTEFITAWDELTPEA
jgi:hypothetical protein